MTSAEHEEVLHGGNVSTVVRVGDTVRRSTGPWTAAVHALLRFLEEAGFAAAPRVLGIDDQGREVLTYVEGECATYPGSPYMWSDDALVAVVTMLREYHDLSRSFSPPADADWRHHSDDSGPPEVICHSDWAPYNAVFRDERFVAMIDWDFARPGSRIWDLAWTAFTWVPLATDEDDAAQGWSLAPDRTRRLRLVAETYRLERPVELVAAVHRRIANTADWIEEQAEAGDAAFVRMRDEGHPAGYRRHVAFLESRWDELERTLA